MDNRIKKALTVLILSCVITACTSGEFTSSTMKNLRARIFDSFLKIPLFKFS